MRHRRLSCVLPVVAAIAACGTGPRDSATVRFVLNAPLCSSLLGMRFSIDGAVVGSDTFRVNLPNPHTTSRAFATAPGEHVLGARVDGGFVWPDTTVTLAAGAAFDDSLPLYCS